jgi:hypothetical protein
VARRQIPKARLVMAGTAANRTWSTTTSSCPLQRQGPSLMSHLRAGPPSPSPAPSRHPAHSSRSGVASQAGR